MYDTSHVESCRHFVEGHFVPTGDVVALALLCGDYRRAILRATDLDDLKEALRYLDRNCPDDAWGTATNVAEWECMRPCCN
jgi:hypothetical protein